MIYHIMYPDKFIDSFIDDIYTLGLQDLNIFLIRGNKNDNEYVNTNKKVTYIGEDQNLYSILSGINKNDVFCVHWYDFTIGDILLNFSNKIIVFAWGGEFLTIPEFRARNFLYDKFSKEFLKNTNNEDNKIKFNFLSKIKKYISNKKLSRRRDIQISNIDYIIISEKNHFEFNMYKKFNPTLNAEILNGFYNSNYDLAKAIKRQKIKNDFNILLGNSADPTNNHFEAINLIANLKGKIYCPLSYGDEKYKDQIIKYGTNIFGNNFIPMKEFLSREVYVDFLAEIDIVIFFHNRSQAFGNIITLLSLGKVIFLKPQNPIFHLIKSIGLNCYDVNKINDFDIKKLIALEKDNRENNLSILEKNYSNEKRLNDLNKIIKLFEINV